MKNALLYFITLLLLVSGECWSQTGRPQSNLPKDTTAPPAKKRELKDTTFLHNLLEALQAGQTKKDTVFETRDFVQAKLLAHKIVPTADAEQLILILNPKLNRSASFKWSTPLRYPKFPKISRKDKKANKRLYKLSDSPDPALATTYTQLADSLQVVLPVLKVSNNIDAEVNKFLANIQEFRRLSGVASRASMTFITGLMRQILELSLQTVSTETQNGEELANLIRNVYDFMPENISGGHALIDRERHEFQATTSAITYFVNPMDEDIPEPAGSQSVSPLSFQVYVFDSRKNITSPKKILKDAALQNNYVVWYRAPMNSTYAKCGRNASVASMNVPMARYVVQIEKDGLKTDEDPIDLRTYLYEQNWGYTNKLTVVVDIRTLKKRNE